MSCSRLIALWGTHPSGPFSLLSTCSRGSCAGPDVHDMIVNDTAVVYD